VSSITQTKAEVQKLIKRYNKLQAEASTDNVDEAENKATQAEKLVSQINMLQLAINKTKAKEFVETKKASTITSSAKSIEKNTENPNSADEKRIALEQRINRIEEAQKKTRVKIEQLNLAKAALSRLQVEAEKNVVSQQNRFKEEQQLQTHDIVKFTSLLQTRETQYANVKKDFDAYRQQAEKDIDRLIRERDAALDKRTEFEQEKMSLLRDNLSNYVLFKGLVMGLGLGILCIAAFTLFLFKTTWLDEIVCELKDTPCYFSKKATNIKIPQVPPVQEKTPSLEFD
jgi:hypothetical protein